MPRVNAEIVRRRITEVLSKHEILELYFEGPKYCEDSWRHRRFVYLGEDIINVKGGDSSDIEASIWDGEAMNRYYYSLRDLDASLPFTHA